MGSGLQEMLAGRFDASANGCCEWATRVWQEDPRDEAMWDTRDEACAEALYLAAGYVRDLDDDDPALAPFLRADDELHRWRRLRAVDMPFEDYEAVLDFWHEHETGNVLPVPDDVRTPLAAMFIAFLRELRSTIEDQWGLTRADVPTSFQAVFADFGVPLRESRASA